MLKTFPAKFLAILLVAFFIANCSKKKKNEEYVARNVGVLYNEGKRQLDRSNYPRAAVFFDEVERQHPYSEWARRAQLMSAYSYYQANDYEEAILAAERFLGLHPGNSAAPYAYYLIALSYYEQITDVGRDQKITEQAMSALAQVAQRFPETAYAVDSRLKIDMTRDHLAGKEMEIGRFYQKQKQYLAALIRFKNVIDDYQTTTHVAEALHRLVEVYLSLGIPTEAQQVASVLGYNFPTSKWYEYSYDLMTNPKLTKKAKASIETVEDDQASGQKWTNEKRKDKTTDKGMKARQRQEMRDLRARHSAEKKAVSDDKEAKKALKEKQSEEWDALREAQFEERLTGQEATGKYIFTDQADIVAGEGEMDAIEETAEKPEAEIAVEEDAMEAESDGRVEAQTQADEKRDEKSAARAANKAMEARQNQEMRDLRARHSAEKKAVGDDKEAKKALKEKQSEEWDALREAQFEEDQISKKKQDEKDN